MSLKEELELRDIYKSKFSGRFRSKTRKKNSATSRFLLYEFKLALCSHNALSDIFYRLPNILCHCDSATWNLPLYSLNCNYINVPLTILSKIPFMNVSVVSLTAPRDVTSINRVWKYPAGPEWLWVPDMTTLRSLYLDSFTRKCNRYHELYETEPSVA